MGLTDFDRAYDRVKSLSETFERGITRYMSSIYQEAEARKDFIDKLFIALGWDVNHDIQLNPYEQEVKVERAISISSSQRRADYAFCCSPNYRDVRFYVEAKKPYSDIGNAENYFQTIRYGWNSGTALAVLTDYDQFHILDCRYKPDPETILSRALRVYHYTDYIDKDSFAEIYWLFSHEAVAGGSIEKRSAELPKPRGKAVQRELFPGAYKPVDEAFLEDLDEYRITLARSFKASNPELDGEALTEIVQRTLDRLVFLRFLEDKQIEQEPIVANLGSHSSAWDDFIATSRRLNSIYDGMLFKHHNLLDSKETKIDETAFAKICESLAHINTPYDFNAIPIYILGSIYERFLGKVLVATEKRVYLEEKAEVKKAGGVYYTPEYIVQYIVDRTVGRIIEGKTPAQISNLRFIDIACGSGSFLLGVYDKLVDYHGNYYNSLGREDRDRLVKRGDCIERNGRIYVSLKKKRSILLNNIYGVDIDSQAIELAQLSLYLKLLKDETIVSSHEHQLEFHEALLPSLSSNLICGNSILGTEILQGKLFSIEEEKKLNPMNFKDAFPAAIAAGGFDVVIGNPPYRRELDYKHLLDQIAQGSLGKKYRCARMDLWYYFVHRGMEIMKPKGLLSFIVNAYWIAGTGSEKLIQTMKDSSHIEEIFALGKMKVFEKVSGQHMIIRIQKGKSSAQTVLRTVIGGNERTAEPFFTGLGKVVSLRKTPKELFLDGKIDIQPGSGVLLRKIDRGVKLSQLGIVRQGIAENPSSINRKTNKKFGEKWKEGEGVFALTSSEAKRLKLTIQERQLLRPYHDLCDLDRYWIREAASYLLIYSTPKTCPDIKVYPNIYAHLSKFREITSARRETRNGSNQWWHLHWPRDEEIWKASKIISIQMAARPSFSCSEQPVYLPFSVNVFVPNNMVKENMKYVLALLNSKVLWHWFSHHAKRRGVGLEINGNVLSSAPIRRINFSIAKEKRIHQELVELVDANIKAINQVKIGVTEKNLAYYESRQKSIDRQIDQHIYQLYGLSEEEAGLLDKEYE